jgi:hypothetical protein
LKHLGIEVPEPPPAWGLAAPPVPIPFTSERELRQAIERGIAGFDFKGLAKLAISNGLDRARGRV